MKKNITILILLFLVIFLLSQNIFNEPDVNFNLEVDILRKENKALKKQFFFQQNITDSLRVIMNNLEDRWEVRNKDIQKIIRRKHDAKISDVYILGDDNTVRLLTDWLSEIDTVRE